VFLLPKTVSTETAPASPELPPLLELPLDPLLPPEPLLDPLLLPEPLLDPLLPPEPLLDPLLPPEPPLDPLLLMSPLLEPPLLLPPLLLLLPMLPLLDPPLEEPEPGSTLPELLPLELLPTGTNVWFPVLEQLSATPIALRMGTAITVVRSIRFMKSSASVNRRP